VILWFAGGSVWLSWMVFHDPAFDYRLVVVGSLLPDGPDAIAGGARVLHTLAASVVVLAAVMVVTRHRRRLRRRLLAIPIGMLMHLLLDGVWTHRQLFWWPAFGWSFGHVPLPVSTRPALLLAAEEVVGAVLLWWAWRRFRLHEPERRRRFFRTGYLGRDIL
jgi:hypothetical protein